jgi:hypothetical protein
MGKPTKEDASLLIQIFNTASADEHYRDAFYWFNTEMNEDNYDDFKEKYPPGSDGYRHFMRMSSYGELVGALVNREVLNEDLVFELYGDMMWEKSSPIVRGMREDLKMPRFLENFEVMALKYPEWAEKNPPKIPLQVI